MCSRRGAKVQSSKFKVLNQNAAAQRLTHLPFAYLPFPPSQNNWNISAVNATIRATIHGISTAATTVIAMIFGTNVSV